MLSERIVSDIATHRFEEKRHGSPRKALDAERRMSASIRVRDLPPSFVLEQPDSTDIPLTILRLSFNGVKGNIDAPRRSAVDPNLDKVRCFDAMQQGGAVSIPSS